MQVFMRVMVLLCEGRYRQAEVPFVVYNVPEVDDVVRKWGRLPYLREKLGTASAVYICVCCADIESCVGDKEYRTETSKTNHFMYWMNKGKNFRNKDGSKYVCTIDVYCRCA